MQALRDRNAAVERDDPDAAARVGLDGDCQLRSERIRPGARDTHGAPPQRCMLRNLTRLLFGGIWSTEMVVVAVRLRATLSRYNKVRFFVR